jgi:hypothetical protein
LIGPVPPDRLADERRYERAGNAKERRENEARCQIV